MPTTLENPQPASGDVDAACCPPQPAVPAPRAGVVVPTLEAEPERTSQLDLHDLELLCGVER